LTPASGAIRGMARSFLFFGAQLFGQLAPASSTLALQGYDRFFSWGNLPLLFFRKEKKGQ